MKISRKSAQSEETIDIREELDAHSRLSGPAKQRVANKLLRAASKIDATIPKADKWLMRVDAEILAEYDEEKEDEWLARLKEYERLCDMRAAIREEVLGG